MKKAELKSAGLLFLAAFIWGIAFVAQSVGMEYVGPLTFNGSRFLLGGTVLLPLIAYRKQKARRRETGDGTSFKGTKERTEIQEELPTDSSIRKSIEESAQDKRKQRKVTLVGGLCCGIAICTASMLQQYGIQYTSVGKAGFITALYIVIVPVLGIFMKKKVPAIVWISAVVAAIGFYFLCITENFALNKGDMLVFLCAICFSFHILVIDHFSPKADGVELSCIQFYVSGIICSILALLLEQPSLEAIVSGALPILYAGILSCGVAYTLQIIGQANMNPTVASLILSLESVISVLAGWVLLKETLTGRQTFGCILVFGAVILAQLPLPKKQN